MHLHINDQSPQTTTRGHSVKKITSKEINPERKHEPADRVISGQAIHIQ